MGSFNTTCVISHQTIKSKDEVYIFPIFQSSSYEEIEFQYEDYQNNIIKEKQYSYANTSCYATAFWDNAGPIIEGSYYDYGQFNLTNSENNIKNIQILFNILYENSAETLEGENKSHDIVFNMKNLYNPKEHYSFEALSDIWSQMYEALQENRIFIKDNSNKYRPFAVTACHKAAGEYFVNQYKDLKALAVTEFNKSYQIVSKYLNYLTGDGVNPQLLDMVNDSLSWPLQSMLGLKDLHFSQGSAQSLEYKYQRSDEQLKEIIAILKDNYKNDPESKELSSEICDKLYNEVKPIMLHKVILAGMEHLNIKLAPMPYAYQDYSNDIGNSYTKMVKEVNKTIKGQLKEEKEEKNSFKSKF